VSSGDDGTLAAHHARTFLRSELTRTGGRVHLYLLDQQPVAMTAELIPHPHEPYPWIGLLLGDGRQHGRGIGAQCVADLHARLAEEGWEEVRLAVLDSNPRARRFWDGQGYLLLNHRSDTAGRRCTVMSRRLRVWCRCAPRACTPSVPSHPGDRFGLEHPEPHALAVPARMVRVDASRAGTIDPKPSMPSSIRAVHHLPSVIWRLGHQTCRLESCAMEASLPNKDQ